MSQQVKDAKQSLVTFSRSEGETDARGKSASWQNLTLLEHGEQYYF